MSQLSAPEPILTEAQPPRLVPPPRKPAPHWPKRALIALGVSAALALVVFGGMRVYRRVRAANAPEIPVAKVQRGDITLAITAKGELRGGNPETLAAPLTGGSEMHITALKKTGEPVKKGDVVAQFDTTEQEFKLKEAQADLAEAEQHLIQAQAQRDADQEEDRYALLKAQADVKLAELDVRKNPLLSTIAAEQNDLALQAARDHLAQVKQNVANRQATGNAGIAIQQAAREKAESQAETARQNIESMTLRAGRSGYVAVDRNTNTNFFFTGMSMPLFQIGDAVQPGMVVAEIPDLNTWDIAANIGELDRGHLAVGDKVAITVIAVPNHPFQGHVKELGGTTGPFWDRHFECTIALDDPSPLLRPGMSVQLVVSTDAIRQALWVPAQALFESDGRTFVYLRSGKTFTQKNITLVRRNETRAVISGLNEGQVVALANPLEMAKKKATDTNPLKTIGR
ncbi:MAG: HlyD family efflux transporter periplasmic adaptor subunit [Acidobacteriaceae bacterium]|nr:HlyD family efflux transporter periplasmic adaptor subunit [Acidobacteriaceae bacterium]MBV9498994.1 HlyD family efflux transporter periplasmic adaptor subunit [Acidobacteriaceae bacterium]